jgi:hypothetical protein
MMPSRTAAVSFPNGTVVNIGRAEGSSHYEEAVRRLSLHSSTHLQSVYSALGDVVAYRLISLT